MLPDPGPSPGIRNDRIDSIDQPHSTVHALLTKPSRHENVTVESVAGNSATRSETWVSRVRGNPSRLSARDRDDGAWPIHRGFRTRRFQMAGRNASCVVGITASPDRWSTLRRCGARLHHFAESTLDDIAYGLESRLLGSRIQALRQRDRVWRAPFRSRPC